MDALKSNTQIEQNYPTHGINKCHNQRRVNFQHHFQTYQIFKLQFKCKLSCRAKSGPNQIGLSERRKFEEEKEGNFVEY